MENRSEISPKDILIHYRVHKLKQGWTEWKEDEAYISPNETRWQMYQTDLLFGLDEGVHDSIEFYYEIPDGVIYWGIFNFTGFITTIKSTNNKR